MWYSQQEKHDWLQFTSEEFHGTLAGVQDAIELYQGPLDSHMATMSCFLYTYRDARHQQCKHASIEMISVMPFDILFFLYSHIFHRCEMTFKYGLYIYTLQKCTTKICPKVHTGLHCYIFTYTQHRLPPFHNYQVSRI